jgi:cellulose synthase/poly-beta-1,6-N-acetylglucosamine synthase-like glycosyltransferase
MREILIVPLMLILAFFVVAQTRIFVIAAYSRTRELARSTVDVAPSPEFVWPAVTIQLPVYREHKVLGRLLAAVTEFEYPDGRLAVQVLDDSEDEEAALTEAVIEPFAGGHLPVDYVRRGSRDGYKAGALNHGTRLLDCELVSIFDADFVPDRDFLVRTVPLFADDKVGAVHTRWRHRNGTSSPLKQMQSAILDSLFCFGSGIRQTLGDSSMYLGTSGVWRRRTIEELGGWREAPFTDDGIDLSFRAQIAGWSVVFVNDALATGDLPETYFAYKNQQRRWARAAFRLVLDYGRNALKPPQGVGRRFLELSSLHLVLSTPALAAAGLLTSVYVVLGLPRTLEWTIAEVGLSLALVLFPPAQEAMLSQCLLYDDWVRRSLRMLLSLPLAIAVSISIVAGFRDTLRREEPEFVRTPKQGADGVIRSSGALWHEAAARTAVAELALGIALLAAATLSVARRYPESWFLLFALTGAFLIAAIRSCSELRARGHDSRRA